ncbi:MAG: hypothetical protein ACK4NE_00085 [Albidovulum sp.]
MIPQASPRNGSLAIGRHNAVLYEQPGLLEDKKSLIRSIARGFDRVTSDVRDLAAMPWEIIPVVGCQMELQDLEEEWIRTGRPFVYWDRGYLNRGGKTWIRRAGPEYFRWQLSAYQMTGLVQDAPAERLQRLRLRVEHWQHSDSKRVVVAAPSDHYHRFHRIEGWTEKAVQAVRDMGFVPQVRHKRSASPLQRDILNARCLVTHGSVAAIEAAVLGCPVVVDPCSAAAPVGHTHFEGIREPVYPDRTEWLRSIAASQFTADEVANGTIWNFVGRA